MSKAGAEYVEVLSTRLRAMRRARGWSQEDLADRAGGGIDQSQISQWEGGRKRPSMESVAKLARAFDMKHEELARELGYLEIDDPPAEPGAHRPGDLPEPLAEALRLMLRDHPELILHLAADEAKPDFHVRVRELALALGYVIEGWSRRG
jgi:transcriptional regulator with XRE-family HTH domain